MPNLPEDKAARIAIRGVNAALREMERVVVRYLADDRELDVRMLNQITLALEQIAQEYGRKVVIGGELGKLLTEVRIKGVTDVLGIEAGKSWLADNKAALDFALHNDQVKIVGILSESKVRINEIITVARITGKSRKKVVAEIMARMTDVGKMTRARAETIYRSETFSGYRQFGHAAALEDGVEKFRMIGVIDSRTTALCLAHVGQVKTAEEWEKISPVVFSYGLHYGCRHDWVPADDEDSLAAKRDTARYKRHREKELAEREAN